LDRNSAIGLILIAILLIAYFNFFAPAPQPPAQETPTVSSQPSQPEILSPAPSQDSVAVRAYGDLAVFATGEEELTTVENDDLIAEFSSRGGRLQSLTLKKFTTYRGEPLTLADPANTSFSLKTMHEGREIDLMSLHYTVNTSQRADTTVIRYTLAGSPLAEFTWLVPPGGYQLGYQVRSGEPQNLQFTWKARIAKHEKGLEASQTNSTVNYYTAAGSFDGLSERSTDYEAETISEPVRWLAVKEQFFTSAIIAEKPFSSASVETSANLADTTEVKRAVVAATIPAAAESRFTFYFGPNNYNILKKVTDGFSRNVYLGWPPVIWVNKFIIIPIFRFLESYIGNYGVIIILLVLFIKIILAPLSYTSYLGMAKMKVLKPELDAIKEKHGDDMAAAQQDQLKLYQQVGVNPLSGCIPVLLQMPILFAMFYFFPVSIELRQQPFLWAEDLSTYDSIMSLPFTIPFYGNHVSLFTLLMTASTLVYTWQNNQLTSVQGPMKSMSYIMPVVFMFVLNSFPAGLSFYYFVSNLVTFAQQALIRRFVDDEKIKKILEENRKKIAATGGKKSAFMNKLQEAMKAGEEARRQAEKKKGKK
jgi:YidC/Oxa1 family membrane protein insertase